MLRRLGISYTFKTISANSISNVIWERPERSADHGSLQKTRARDYMDQTGLLANATAIIAKAEISVIAIGMASECVNIHFTMEREQFNTATTVLNKAVA